jgi:hypothetical protein
MLTPKVVSFLDNIKKISIMEIIQKKILNSIKYVLFIKQTYPYIKIFASGKKYLSSEIEGLAPIDTI